MFFTHGSKAWPALFTRFTMRRLAWSFLALDVDAIANWVVMSEVHHQHFIKNATWFMECCHREASGLGERAMLIMGTDDDKVDGLMTAEYFAANHPDVRVHCTHPTNLKTVMKLNREFLCGTSHGSPTTVRAQLGARDERTACRIWMVLFMLGLGGACRRRQERLRCMQLQAGDRLRCAFIVQ